ncbi:Gfo/Idh/MocA family oxidoreductase [Alphaproteobacteria bacterium]|nr:Gfo/Idh/MocA family oxidoreductase [Alphaproteobacteria bacterium]
MSINLKIGIIGLGVGEAHLRSYQQIPNVEVVSVCDIDPARLKSIADNYNISGRYIDSKFITEDPNIDIVSICSYDNFHAEQLISCFRNGKHVMVEKPVVLFKEDAEAVVREWKDSRCKVTSNLILRESPRFKNIKNMILKKDFGEIYHIEGDYLHNILHKITDGWRGKMPFYSTVYGGGIHLIDLMRWLMNDEVKEVCAMGNNILTKNTNYKYPEIMTSLLQFNRGATGKNTSTYGPQRTKFHSLNIFGTKKSYVNHRGNGEIFSGDSENDLILDSTPYPGFLKGDLLPEFISSIRQDVDPIVTGEDIFRVMDVCFAIWESYKKKKTVEVSYVL